ncbi:PREDICTED: organic cation transporter protein-like isoform X2 [Nicrophorus vespilloides]|uniref:Organic cation transporter protein-like isoform X2 n=1 Tax=Nicrophorus vespilloides TaxID=110193 RepID=A0ABM1N730_NICVS|nr:PREDICTED: organic cation transporter protein-like isoform X2 [Nicrophorus vespilloides]XP_017782629.1 PREDICTED: organic cation transporter protein-like isoform X2 [Nicrophorus vespilloides]XP_017782630.1 PREDICTED: organic cation transporter protein-like isoform X2 [Nicrophorus vespilloides]
MYLGEMLCRFWKKLAMPQERKNEEEEDIISTSIGEYGRWQLMLTFLLSLLNIPCTWHIFSPTFHARDMDTWCARPSQFADVDAELWRNYTQPTGYCSIIDTSYINVSSSGISILPGAVEVPCTNWEFGGDGDTIISEFSLLCDRKQLNNLAEMMFLGGVAIGGLASGVISDKYGRKKTLIASVLIQTFLGVSIAFAPWFEMYFILRAMLGFISVSVVFSGFVLSIEIVGGFWRTVAGISYLFPVSLSYVMISGIAYQIRDWRQLQLAISLPGILFSIYWWVIPESPRWLLAMGRHQEVMTILQRAAVMNKRELPLNLDKQLLPANTKIQTESVGIMDLFKTPKMRKITLLLFVIWFSVYLVYYGLVLNVGNIGGDLYVNSILSGLVEVPAIAISILFLLKCGRKWPLALTMKFAGIACLLTVPIPYIFSDVQWLITSSAMTGKFLISSSNAVMPVFTAELFPTTIRNIGVGASNVSAGMALMIVPYLWEMAMFHDCVPMAIVGVCGVIGGTCVLFLPETGNAPLKDTLGDEDTDNENTSSTVDLNRV